MGGGGGWVGWGYLRQVSAGHVAVGRYLFFLSRSLPSVAQTDCGLQIDDELFYSKSGQFFTEKCVVVVVYMECLI